MNFTDLPIGELLNQRLTCVEHTLGRITQIGVPNSALIPGVPPVEITHPTAAVQA